MCEGAPVNFQTQASATSNARYVWTGVGGFSSNLQNPSINAAQLSAAGVYSCKVTANGCESTVANINLVVNPYPATPVPSNDSVCGEALKLNASTITGATYKWEGLELTGQGHKIRQLILQVIHIQALIEFVQN